MRFRCYACRGRGGIGPKHEFESDLPVCPGCGGMSMVVALTDVHFLIPDPAGSIQGMDGGRWRIGCDPARDYLMLDPSETYAATGEAQAVTCRSCMGLPIYAAAMKLTRIARKALITPSGGECC